MKESLRIGWNSVKVNRVPMLVLWALAASLAFAYYRLPGFAELLAPVKDWQARNGAVAAFATQFFFCGVLPAVFLSVVSEIKTEHHLLKCVLQSVWSGSWGIVYLWFYALQTRMFGGFKSDIALSKLFRRRFGMSLLAWRRQNRHV